MNTSIVQIVDLQVVPVSFKADQIATVLTTRLVNDMFSIPKVGSEDNIITSSCQRDVIHTDSKMWWLDTIHSLLFCYYSCFPVMEAELYESDRKSSQW